ncbi:MAG TPA: hypothetical protein VME20_00820 [Acidimicrobiales bacterium]|nr:hypothetical protein [Acidimicrobiales bacterium]HUB70887.1 hypothetical protein [Acidimicrobiales bacterium]
MKHRARGRVDDSLSVVAEQDRLLVEIFKGWDATAPGPDVDGSGTFVRSAYERGTYGKLLIEHAALRVAAKRDVARVLRDTGSAALAEELVRHLPEVCRLLDLLDEMARGVNAMGVAASTEFARAVDELGAVLRADLDTEQAQLLPRVQVALGEHRGDLHSSHWARYHAPTHPAPSGRWYNRVPLLVRIQARYDELRGFPRATSTPMADPKVAGPIDDGS